ncbi:MAG: Gfo/Idh/MocA family oxidoreductase [Acutalibacteraceae bacterium]|nr:Gfo/Idh/MocA family oxidoreductase [Clostridia bacterium]MEE1330970.1 Gfo/Idh/MocA family oxidoreductase [Acutalibacteraceae bacterium]
MSTVRVGIIGVGGIANGRHIPELLQVKDCKITAICDINENALKSVGDKLGIDEAHRFTDYKDLIKCSDVDAVEVCTPNYLHVPMAAEAVSAGKPINVEKPLSTDLLHTKDLKEALEKNPVPNMMCFSYRFFPAVRFAKWILEKNMIGDIVSIDVQYLKSSAFDEGRRLDWRFVKEYAGTGVLGDLGVHLIDMAEFLVGKINSVSASTGIVVKERKKIGSEEIGKVETDDFCNFIADIEGGVSGTFVITRCAIGNANTIKFDIFGTDGVISFNLNNPNVLSVCIGEVDKKGNGLHTVTVPGQFKITQEQMFINMVNGKPCKYLPTVNDGLRAQNILDSLLLSSEEKRWVDIK